MPSLCCRKIVYVLASVVAVSLGGWRIWSMASAPPGSSPPPAQLTNSRPEQPALAQVKPDEPAPEQETSPGVAKPYAEAVVLTESEPLLLESLKKRPQPTGKQHEPQDKLLMTLVQQLHSEAYERFIRQPGAGFDRMGPIVSIAVREWKTPYWSADELTRKETQVTNASTAKDLDLIHRSSAREFYNSTVMTPEQRVLNAVKLRPPHKKELWEVKSLDLIGLVVHDRPIAYVSEKIPDMKDLASKPTRPLDYFELGGLEHLLKGEDLFVRSKEGTIRVLGPLRAGSQCLKCHGDVKEGDLLGAFSYTLRPGQYVMRRGGKTVPAPNVAPSLDPLP